MAASGSALCLNAKPKSRTAVNERCGMEDLQEMKEGVLEFGIGAPSFKMLSKLKPLLAEATRQRMESEGSGYMFTYGALRGDRAFVQELGKFLSERYVLPVNCDDIVCTAGATNGLLMLASIMFKHGDYVFVEDATYFLALEVFRDDLGMNIVPVPIDKDGVNVETLEQLILQHQDKLGKTSAKRPYRAIFYTIPVFHNPTTACLSPERCTALIKVLRKYDVLAVCDDVYNLVNFQSTPPPKRLFTYDKKSDCDYKGHVVSNGSFSKIVGPGLRLGWLEAPELVVEKIIFSAVFKSGGGVNQYTSAIMGTALRNGVLSQYMTEALSTFKSNMEVMCDALDKYAKPYVKYVRPKGGYFVWVELPSECDAKAFKEYCIENSKVSARPGSGSSPTGNYKNFLRLSFAFVEEEEIDNGIRNMATALQNFLKQ